MSGGAVDSEKEKKVVFVTVGTTCFDALVKSVDSQHVRNELRKRGYTNLLIQMGRGSYIPSKSCGEDESLVVDYFTFSPSIADYMKSASLIISHAGSGSIFETLRLSKPLIVVVNEDLMDNHQSELAEELADRKHLFCASPQTLDISTLVKLKLEVRKRGEQERGMGQEEAKKVVVEGSTEEAAPPPAKPAKDVAEEKSVNPPAPEEKVDELKSLAIVEKVADPSTVKSSSTSADRDAILARVETEKKMSLIRAWEESEKVKAENKAVKKFSAITAWENAKKATTEAELKKKEEELEKKKAEYAEKMKNKIAMIHKEAEEKRAMVEAKRGEEILKVDEIAAKYRATGLTPKKLLGCF